MRMSLLGGLARVIVIGAAGGWVSKLLAENVRLRAGEAHDVPADAECQMTGLLRLGRWGEFVVAPARVLHRLPDHVSFDAAVLVEPGACVVKALERARIEPAETVGVVGVGAMGALAIRIARLRSPGERTACP